MLQARAKFPRTKTRIINELLSRLIRVKERAYRRMGDKIEENQLREGKEEAYGGLVLILVCVYVERDV